MIDPLFDAVESLSNLLGQLRELRRCGEIAEDQIEEVGAMIDETVEWIVSVLQRVRETSSKERQSSINTSAAEQKAFA
jgi:hypothetical protein